MKGILSLLFIIIAATSICGQSVSFNWVKQNGRANVSTQGHAITTDAAGNVYTTGSVSNNIFISKSDAAGNVTWTKEIGDGTYTNGGLGISIAVDAAGNVYTTGAFFGTVDFDPGPAVFNLASNESDFILKLNANGNFTWARQVMSIGHVEIGSLRIDFGNLLAIDAAGNIYTTGNFEGTVDFDPGAGVFNLTAINADIFILKLDAAGNFLWAKQMPATTSSFGQGISIALDAQENVYTTGYFSGIVDFDPGPAVFNLNSSELNIFILKLDAAGNFIWAKQMGQRPGNFGEGFSIKTDPAGNVYTTGFFRGTFDFDPGPAEFNLTSDNNDVFVSKLDGAGNFLWATQMGSSGIDEGLSLTVDAAENVYTTGYGVINDVTIDTGVCVSALSTGKGSVFISKLDVAGNLAWAKQLNCDAAYSIAVDAGGDVYTTGWFSGIDDFDPGASTYFLISLGEPDAFIQKLSPCNNSTYSTITISACNTYVLNCITYTKSGVYTQILSNAAGCDSILTLNLTIKSPSYSDVTISICYGTLYQIHDSTGIYIDTLVSANGCDSIRTLRLIVNRDRVSFTKKTICAGESYLGYTASGTYTVEVTATNGCDSIQTIELLVLPKPAPDLGVDQNLCAGDTLSLDPGQFDTYTWQDGSTETHYTVKQAGNYSVNVSNQCGSARAAIVITAKDCTIYFPSAFTPNKDGKNDLFKILNPPSLSDYDLMIYNRWGQKIFETKNYTEGWDGTINGQTADTGIYAWFCKFRKTTDAGSTVMKGTIALIR